MQVIALLVTAWLFLPVIRMLREGLSTFEWDFLAYRRAARAFLNGDDPYAISTQPGHLRFLYPPLTLSLFTPFALLAERTSVFLWLALKFLALGIWGWLVSRRVLKTGWNVISALAFAWGFRETIPADLLMGNISIFEQLVLWIGFICLIEGRSAWFAGCVVAVAQFKLLPMAFLLLIPLMEGRGGWKRFGEAIAAGAAVCAVNLLFEELFGNFLGTLLGQHERGAFAPSSYAFALDVTEAFDRTMVLGTRLYQLFAAAIAVATWWGVRRFRSRDQKADRVVIVGAACVAYALIVPRMKDYSYALLIVPALIAIQREWRARRFSVDLLLVFVPSTVFTKLFGDISASWIAAYWPLFCALVLARVYGLALMTPRWASEPAEQASDAIVLPAAN